MENILSQVQSCDSYALATSGSSGLNLIPLSVVEVKNSEIYLYDFFMNKTAENIKENPKVALTGWKGLEGVQIKASANYQTEGTEYDEAVAEMKERFPDRTLNAVIRLSIETAYDVTPGSTGRELG